MKNKENNTPVIQDWVCALNWKQQTGLISAIRCYDVDMDVNDTNVFGIPNKYIIHMLRYLILNNADSKTKFMTDQVYSEDDVANTIFNHTRYLDGYLIKHWVDHILLAITIIKDNHPNPYVRKYYDTVLTSYNLKLENWRKEEVLEEQRKHAEVLSQAEEEKEKSYVPVEEYSEPTLAKCISDTEVSSEHEDHEDW